MAKKQYEEVQAGPQSTNRFIQKPTIPTTVVTGATTAPAKAQPNLTGKRKLPVPAPDGDSQTAHAFQGDDVCSSHWLVERCQGSMTGFD